MGDVTLFGDSAHRFLARSEQPPAPPCHEAQALAAWLAEYVIPYLARPLAYSQVATLKWLLQDQWQAHRRSLPPRHNSLFSQHPCVDDLYQGTYDRLHLLQINARPPDLTAVDWMSPPKRRKKGAAPTPEEVDAVLDQLIFGVQEP